MRDTVFGPLHTEEPPVTPTLVGRSIELDRLAQEVREPSAEVSHERVPANPFGRSIRCAIISAGILLSLCVYGILQERIMALPYETEFFESSIFLVFCNRIVSTLAGVVLARWRGESLAMAAPAHKFGLVSAANCAAAFCQYEALKWVSFPIQVLGKSFKLVPVMLWASAMLHKQYGASDWVISVIVSIGVFCFLLGGNITATHRQEESGLYGLLLLVGFLVLDSFTSTFQEKLFRDHDVTKANQMLHVNSFSISLSLVALLASKDALSTLQFCVRHVRLPVDALSLSVASAVSQFFILSMVKEFGALALAAAMNVRQLLSVLLSYGLYGHALTPLQAIGLVLVFSALLGKCTWRLLLRRVSSPSVMVEVADCSDEDDKPSPEDGGHSRVDALPTEEEPEPEK